MKSLPLEVMNTHVAIVGKTGSGKTYAAKGLVERMLDDNRRVVILDPTGAWWGLRSRIDREGLAEYPVPIIGGEHGDVPLKEEDAGPLARWLCTSKSSAVIDVSELGMGERHRFVEHFAEHLYAVNKGIIHLIVDEADEFVPQNPLPDTRRMLSNMDRIVRRGRVKGFRVTLITQRPAVLHKNVLTQANTLIAMKLMAPQDRKAIEAWILGQGDTAEGKKVLDTLAKLKVGEGWVWSPDLEILERHTFGKNFTYDSSKAPDEQDGEEPALPPAMDLASLKEALAGAEAADSSGGEDGYPRGFEEGQRSGYEKGYEVGYQKGYEIGTEESRTRLTKQVQDALLGRVEVPLERDLHVTVVEPSSVEVRSVSGQWSTGHCKLPKAERLILTALAQYPQGRTVRQTAILTGYSHKGGGFRNPLSRLRSGKLIAGKDTLVILPAGLKALGAFTPLPRGKRLLEHWYGELGKAERKILEALAAAYPKSLSPGQAAHQAGYDPGGGGFRNPLSRLRTLGLVEGRGELKASREFFA